MVVHRCYPLPDQQCSLGLFRSLSPLRTRVQLPHAGLLYQCHPSLLIFSLSFSLINQCQAVQQQGQHSFPACLLSSSCMSLCVDPPPPSARAATIILSHGHRAEAQGPHCQHERFTGSVRGGQKKKKVRRRQCSHFNLFFVWPQEKKKGSLHHLHNSWNTQGEKNGPLSGKEKSLDGVIMGGVGVRYVCQPLCPQTYLSCFSPFISAPHTHSHCLMFAINL